MEVKNMKKYYLIISLILLILFIGFVDPYARRIFPITSVPTSCAENSVAYSMTLHKLYICKDTGYAEIVTGASSFAPVGATYITQTPNATLTNEQALSALSTGILKNTTTTGVLSIAVGSDLPSGITYSQLNLTNSILNGDIVSLAWSKITGTPTTFAGYGISDTSANFLSSITNETGSGLVVGNTSPTFITPSLGVASGTSLALGGATIGTDALGITGTATISGTLTTNGNIAAAGDIVRTAVFSLRGSLGLSLVSASGVYFSNSSSEAGTKDVSITRNGVNILQIGNGSANASGSLSFLNGTVGGTLAVTGTSTLTGNTTISVGGTTSAQTDLLINPTTKASGNFVDYQVNSVSKFSVASSGAITNSGTNSIGGQITLGGDLIGSGNIRAGASNSIYWNGRSLIQSPSDGVIELSNQAITDFTRLQFGGTTSSFPAIKRNGVTLEAKLADDSAYTTLRVLGLIGTTTNDSASTGNIGEYVQSVIAPASAVSLTSTIVANVTSISLTAGDWDVTGIVGFTAYTTGSYVAMGISSTSATLNTTTLGENGVFLANNAPTVDSHAVVPSYRVSISGTTTYYLVARAGFTVGSCTAYGRISARRVR